MNPVEGVGHAVAGLEPSDVLVAVGYVVIGSLVALELAPWWGRSPRPEARRALSLAVTAVVSLALAPLTAGVLSSTWGVVGSASPPPLRQLWDGRPVVGAVACFVAVDAAAWAYHWLGHHTRVGWASHRVHHLGESYDATLVLRQPWLQLHALAVLPVVALLGFRFEVAAACSTVSLVYQAAQHTSRTWSLGWMERLLVSGRAHRAHHLVDGGERDLGAVLSVWDRALGTRSTGGPRVPERFGTGRPEPVGALRNQLEGWSALVAPRPLAGPGRAATRGDG